MEFTNFICIFATANEIFTLMLKLSKETSNMPAERDSALPRPINPLELAIREQKEVNEKLKQLLKTMKSEEKNNEGYPTEKELIELVDKKKKLLKVKDVFLSTYVAGFGYADGESVLNLLKPGKKLRLVREPGNKHDSNAVAIFFSNTKIGYVPKYCNSYLAKCIDDGLASTFFAYIFATEPSEHFGKNILFNIEQKTL